jgi:P4 family phage/plasmid primase-like protien
MLKQPDSGKPALAVELLQHIRPGGPWTLTAIIPDGSTETVTTKDTKDVKSFIDKYNGTRNLYYTINPLRRAMNTKPAKSDIAAVEYLQADLDPRDNETPEDAKARYLTAVTALGLEPFTNVDSGNGIQVLYKLDKPTTDFAAAEARSLALTLKLGGKSGTQNIDRLFRLPGTINLPNKKKLKTGRTICESRLISTSAISYPLDAFPAEGPKPIEPPDGEDRHHDLPNQLASLLYIQGSGAYPTRSELLFAFLTGALRARVIKSKIIEACIDTSYAGASIFEHVKENGGRPYVQRQIEHAQEKVTESRAEQQLTELGNARRLVKRCGEDIRFVHVWNSWVIWKDGHWRRDEDGAIMRLAKASVDDMLQEAVGINDEAKRNLLLRHAMQTQKAAQLRNMVALAESEASVVLSANKWDADPLVLGVQNGVIDLRTGSFREARREDYITKLAGTNFDPDAECPNWEAFLLKIFSDDKEFISYVQRACGYMMTGLTVEEILFVLWGTGSNGKSTFRETIFRVFGDYAVASDASLLITQKKSGATPDLMRLFGRRLNTINETEENDHLNESRVKFITGHDTITARNLYEGFVDFLPTHKTMLTTNHKPIVRGTDDGIWRRIDLWPFVVKIPDEEKDRHWRKRNLQPQHPGILNWLLKGAKEYLHDGLKPPRCVRNATSAYRKDMDLVGQWIEERCELDARAETVGAHLYYDYSNWTEDEVGFKLTAIAFGRNLSDRGFEPTQVKRQRGFKGLKLRPVEPS